MCMDICEDCGRLVNTDNHPEVYRDEWHGKWGDYTCLCDNCYEERLEFLENMNELEYAE